MPAKTPEEICGLFKRHMAAGDIESLLDVYDLEVVFLNQRREVKQGRQQLREELAPLAAAKATFDFSIKQVINSGDIALMHTEWTRVLSEANALLRNRSCSSPAGWHMALAYW